MRITAGENLLARLSLQNSPGVLAAANSALDAVTVSIENTLGTSLAKREIIDYFSLNKKNYEGSSGERLFLLTQGYLTQADPVTVKYSPDATPLAADSDGLDLEDEHYHIDKERGLVILYGGVVYGRSILSVRYTAGFDPDQNDPDVYTDVPEWLKEAALYHAARSMNAYTVSKRKRDVQDVSSELSRFYSTTLNEKIRPLLTVIPPITYSVY